MEFHRIILFINTILFGSVFLPASAFALFSPMVFDAPGSTENPGIVVYFISTLTFPLAIIISLGVCWFLNHHGYHWSAVVISFLPWINTIALVFAFTCLGMVV